ncbi:MAG: hypothetical protein CM15mP74_23800 [Halieaceae bacterium]|nr:MAG: hypothetical protein CM15mP74_23800 [Halieaceae bacterium]
MIEGTVYRSKPIRVLRDNLVIYEGELESLRRFKDDANEVRTGLRCGIGVKNYYRCESWRPSLRYSTSTKSPQSLTLTSMGREFERTQRVSHFLHEELARLLQSTVRDPRVQGKPHGGGESRPEPRQGFSH